LKYYYNPPWIIKKAFQDFNWNTKNNKVLLTFDDGPIPETTESILKLLDHYNVKSVFFCVGNNIQKNPGLAKEILSCGHEIGNHTFNHRTILGLDKSEMIGEIVSCNNIAHKLLDYKIKHFRPPHGRFSLKLNKFLKKEGLSNVMWSLLTFDYKNNLNIVKFALKNYMRPDSIIVLHDSLKSRDIISDSIKATIDEVLKKEYEFGVPSECLK
jgi:peptidoglycan/xylan/chitin deacetylase (PgdA/CDA1 family)